MQEAVRKVRRILVVDNDPDSLEIISEALSWEGFAVQRTPSGKEALELIQNWEPDLIVLERNMPQMNGLEVIRDLRRKLSYVSIIFMSGDASSEAVIEGLDAGADDYVAKPFDPLELLARVRAQIRNKDLHDQLRSANERLKELVDTDDLTGLFNMRSLFQRLEVELERGRRYNRQVAVVMLDMDHFKSVNDGHDHLFGSFVLSEVGAIIRQSIRSLDIGARYGGDEFLIVLTETDAEGTSKFCERLRKTIAKHHFVSGPDSMYRTASLGFAITHPGQAGVDPRSLVRAADMALYQAKHAGRNCVRQMPFEAPAESTTTSGRKAG
ncbi:MAG: diguanylate cyclase [Bdellovibrionaceae bacterium]|nr:diguanylate cyclase [Pseudobdellovibrionaceae bacterium]